MNNEKVWEKFNSQFDTAKLSNEIAEAEKNGDFNSNYKEVPCDSYDVKIEKLELGVSKKNNPMLTAWFKILAGEYKGSLIFMNQVIIEPFQIHIANEFLRSLDSGLDVNFVDFKQYNNLIMDISEAINEKLEYCLDYSETKKGFKSYKIKEVYES